MLELQKIQNDKVQHDKQMDNDVFGIVEKQSYIEIKVSKEEKGGSTKKRKAVKRLKR